MLTLLAIFAAIFTPSAFAASPKTPKDISAAERAKIAQSWIARAKQAGKERVKRSAQKKLTPQEVCEDRLHLAFQTAGTQVEAVEREIQEKKREPQPIEAVLTLSSSSLAGVMFSYGLMGKMQAKVQAVEAVGVFPEPSKLVFGGEHAPKGEFVFFNEGCAFTLNDQRPFAAVVQAY